MRRQVIAIVVIGVIVLFSASLFAQTCPVTKGGEATKGCAKAMTKCIGNKVACPVMGTVFKADKDTTSYEHDGRIYYFCCPGCVGKFKADPKKYIK